MTPAGLCRSGRVLGSLSRAREPILGVTEAVLADPTRGCCCPRWGSSAVPEGRNGDKGSGGEGGRAVGGGSECTTGVTGP